jgi:hypothetical protein
MSEIYEDGLSNLGLSHYRRRDTTKEITSKTENGIHIPGKDFNPTIKESSY